MLKVKVSESAQVKFYNLMDSLYCIAFIVSTPKNRILRAFDYLNFQTIPPPSLFHKKI